MAAQQYIGITLGPISRIMTYTQSTKSLWGASYFMSYLAKQLIREFFGKRDFLKPQLQEAMWTIHDGVGRFPDQYIFESSQGDFEKLLLQRKKILAAIGEEIAHTLGRKEKEEITRYLEDTIKIYILEMNQWDPSRNIVEQCQEALNTMECRDCYPIRESYNYLADYFEKIHTSNLFMKDAFGEERSGYRLFKTIIECSAAEAVNKKLIQRDDLFKDEKVELLPSAYKYIAFVSADGDNIGKALGKLGDKMSRLLLEYNKNIVQKVNKWGGQVIYSGGDDLLFFAPITSIFTLIAEIDESFNANLISSPEMLNILHEHNMPIPTLSFGISISYYKHPMSESMKLSEELLQNAKDAGRNRIVWNVRKHSGQSIRSSFYKKDTDIFKTAIEIIEISKIQPNDVFLHSVSHYLLQHQPVLNHILSGVSPNKIKTGIENYMASTFEDGEHQKHDASLQLFRHFLLSASTVEADKNEAIKKLHALLKFAELLISKKEKTI